MKNLLQENMKQVIGILYKFYINYDKAIEFKNNHSPYLQEGMALPDIRILPPKVSASLQS